MPGKNLLDERFDGVMSDSPLNGANVAPHCMQLSDQLRVKAQMVSGKKLEPQQRWLVEITTQGQVVFHEQIVQFLKELIPTQTAHAIHCMYPEDNNSVSRLCCELTSQPD
jgi:hypothetical protein